MSETFTNFLSMGGYGSFIWAAFGLSAIVLIGLFIQSQRFLKSSEGELNALQEKSEIDET